jgi:ankyrin repeat protein
MINARDSEGRTVLMLATMYGNGAAVQALLAHPYHADPRVPNNDGEDALDIARKVGNPVITHDIEAAMTVRGIVLDHNALRDATAQEWPELPREVFDHEILPFLE